MYIKFIIYGTLCSSDSYFLIYSFKLNKDAAYLENGELQIELDIDSPVGVSLNIDILMLLTMNLYVLLNFGKFNVVF